MPRPSHFRHACAAALAGLFLAGCSARTVQPPEDFKQCSDPRPQMCTREYKPVCANRDTGIRCVTTPCPAAEWKTYGNACDACSDKAVTGYRPGACE